MHYFKLKPPSYASEKERSRENPIEVRSLWSIPGLHCPACGQTWAGSRKTYLLLNEGVKNSPIAKKLVPGVLEEQEWVAVTEELKHLLGLPSSYIFWPGDALELPRIDVNQLVVPNDFLWSRTFELIVTQKVVDHIVQEGLTGYSVIEPVVRSLVGASSPKLYILAIEGTAWRLGSIIENMTVCQHCKRWKPRANPTPELDIARWDGSDFFNIDMNPNYIYVNERARISLSKLDSKNLVFEEPASL